MAALTASKARQWPLVADFTWSVGDTMTNAAGNADEFATVASHVFDAIKLPYNAIVIGGEVVTETAATGSTAYNISVGDANNTTRYLGATDKTTATRTAITPTGYVGDGSDIRITVAPTVATATAGTFTVRIQYVIRGRTNEMQTT